MMKKLVSVITAFVMLLYCFNFTVPVNSAFEGTSSTKSVSYMPPNPEVYPDFYKKDGTESGMKRASVKHPAPRIERVADIERVPAAGAVEKVLAIPISFTDEAFDPGRDKAYFDGILTKMQEYYETNSRYLLDSRGMSVETTVVDAVYSDYEMAYYGGDTLAGIDDANGNVYELAREAVQKLEETGFDFSDFDTDGDNIIDHLFIIHAGYGQEEASDSDLIWSHSWAIEGGEETSGGVYAYNYVTVPETGQLGTFAHEFGHDIGLPDLYDTDGLSGGKTYGVGDWDLMGSGSWNRASSDKEWGTSPANLSAWSRMYMGWTVPETVTQNESITVTNTDGLSSVLKFWTKGDTSGTEYFLSEYRRKLGFDAGLPGEGLMIWHIDQELIDSKFGSNTINADETRLGVELEQADGNWNLWNLENTGDAGDPFPGTSTNNNFTAVPYGFNYSNISGQFSYVAVSNISTVGSNASGYYYVEAGNPTAPSVLHPDNESVVSTTPTFIWGMSAQAECFILQISEDSSFESGVKEYIFENKNDGMKYFGDRYEFTIPDSDAISPDTQYYWRIAGLNDMSNIYNINWVYRHITTIGTGGNNWSSMEDMPTSRDRLCTVELDGKIYALGGGKDNSYSKKLEVYDPVNDVWATKASMLTERMEFGAAAVNGKIYVFGGYNGGNALSTVEEYDPVSDEWTTGTSMPVGMRSFGTAVLDGKIYIVGGYNELGISDVMLIYNPSTDSWGEMEGAPTGRIHLGVASANDKIYAIGGYNENISEVYNEKYLMTVEEYDPITETWIAKSDLPKKNTFFGITAINDLIYVMGGSGIDSEGINIFGTVHEYNPVEDVWSEKTSMNTSRYGLAATSVDGKIYAIGGSMGTTGVGGYLGVVEAYEPDKTAPYVNFSFDGTDAGKLVGIDSTMEYSLDGGVSYTQAASDQQLTSAQIASITADNNIRVRFSSLEGAVKIIDILSGGLAPAVVADNRNNIIKYIDSTMEFSTNKTTWTKYNNNLPDLTGIITVYVRVAATGCTLPSSIKTLNFTDTITTSGGGGGGGGGGTPTVTTPVSIADAGLILREASLRVQINDTTKTEVTIDIPADAKEQSVAIDTSAIKKLNEKNKGLLVRSGAVELLLSPGSIGEVQLASIGETSQLKLSIGEVDKQQAAGNAGVQIQSGNGLLLVGNRFFEFQGELIAKDKNQVVTGFEAPARISVSLKAMELSGVDPEKLGVYYYNETTKEWEYYGGNYDAAVRTISFGTEHFSYYAIMEYNKTFGDTTNHWAKGYIEKMAAKHIAKGENGSFRPEASISRAEFTALLVRSLGLKGAGEGTAFSFTDVPEGKWYVTEINKAYSSGIARKEDGVTFRPDVEITREEIVVMIARALQYEGKAEELSEAQIIERLGNFSDYEQVASGAREAFAIALGKEIVKGRTADTISPKGNATRAEAIVMIYRLLNVK